MTRYAIDCDFPDGELTDEMSFTLLCHFALHGFEYVTGDLFLSREGASAVDAVLAVQDASSLCPWFKDSLYGLSLWRVAEVEDLTSAL